MSIAEINESAEMEKNVGLAFNARKYLEMEEGEIAK